MRLRPIKASAFDLIDETMQRNLKMSGVVVVADEIYDLWDLPKGTNTVILIGGRGGMKTYTVSDFIAHQAAVNKKRCVVLRDEKSSVKDSILNEILNKYDAIPFNTNTERMLSGLKDKDSNRDVVFTKGFKASSNQKKANMKGVSDIDIAVVEEMEDIIDADKFNTFIDSLRKEGCLVILILNTPDIGHFIIQTYFDTITAPIPKHIKGTEFEKDFEGYFEITPKKGIPGFACIQTGYQNNPYLPTHIVDRYNSYGDPKSHMYNPHYYMTAIMGYSSTGRKGQVLKKVKPITLKEYMAIPAREFYGQDFGTASPAGFVGVKFVKNNCYCRQINYLPMNTLAIGKLYASLKLSGADRIIADNADEKAWKKLRRGWNVDELDAADLKKFPALLTGFEVFPCVKGTDSVTNGIDLMDTMNLFAVSESTDLWNEIRKYCYDQDKYGNFINEPIDDFNHLIDPWRYVVNDQRGKKKFEITTE